MKELPEDECEPLINCRGTVKVVSTEQSEFVLLIRNLAL